MRVFLFGVDGLTFRILHPLIDRGLLPHFQSIRDGGVEGVLKSTIPPATAPAWTSIATGLSPAKHGVYDFWEYNQTKTGPQPYIMTHRRGGKAIWNILSEWGKKVIVANVPMTYPPEPVNGIMLSGYMAPGLQANVTYPSAFKQELLKAVPGYQIDLRPSASQIGDPLAETLAMTRERIAMLQLLLEQPWDFFFLVFTGADRIQHLCWDKIIAFHPQAVRYYQMVDQALGMVLSTLHDEDLLMIVSDHGFQGVQRKFSLQEYLRRQGLVSIREDRNNRRAELRSLLRELVWAMGLRGFPTLLRGRLRRWGIIPVVQEHHPVEKLPYAWEKTSAWIPSPSGAIAGYADIFLAPSISEEQISALMAELMDIHDPLTGQRLLAEIYREDIFGTGAFMREERHLILLSNDNMSLLTDFGLRRLWNRYDRTAGTHHLDGVLYLYGAGVKQGTTITPAHIYDVVPTILSSMQIPPPAELDGKIMREAFDPSYAASSETEDKIAEKLKALASRETS